MVHARPIVGKKTARVRQHDLEFRETLHHAIENQVTDGDRGFQRITDHVVEVMIDKAVAVGVSQRVHEDDDIELLRLGKELVEAKTRIGQIFAIDVGQDFHAAHAEFLHAAFEFARRHRRILQGHRAHRHKAVRPGRGDFRQSLIGFACKFKSICRFGPVITLVGGRADRLDIDAHAIHVFQAHFDRRQLGAAILHLFDVHLFGQRIGELAGRLILGRVQRRNLGRQYGILIMAVNINTQAAAFAITHNFGRGAACRHRAAVAVCRVVTVLRVARKHHDAWSFRFR